MIHKQIAGRYCPVDSVDIPKKRNHNLVDFGYLGLDVIFCWKVCYSSE